MAFGVPGMSALRDHLLAEIDKLELSAEEATNWEAFKPLLQATDLESALQNMTLCDTLADRLLQIVHKLFSAHDHDLFQKLVHNKLDLPLTRLLSFYFRTTQKTLSVITTNYDRLIEFAADWGDFTVYTGFSYGYARKFNSTHPWRVVFAPRTQKKTIDLWKVHGSTDWYHTANGTNISATLPIDDFEHFKPLMIYPGIRKYESAWAEPYRTVISQTDDVLGKAEGYIACGYGFNDQHIQAKLVERIHHAAVPIVCITQTLTASARNLLLGGRCRHFLALEEAAGGGTRVYSESNLAGTTLAADYWHLNGFLKLIL